MDSQLGTCILASCIGTCRRLEVCALYGLLFPPNLFEPQVLVYLVPVTACDAPKDHFGPNMVHLISRGGGLWSYGLLVMFILLGLGNGGCRSDYFC